MDKGLFSLSFKIKELFFCSSIYLWFDCYFYGAVWFKVLILQQKQKSTPVMINHVVLFKLKEFETEKEKSAMRDQIKSSLLGLKGKIDELKYIEVGNNYQLDSASYDICLITHFESFDDLKKYAVHPEHLKAVDLVRNNTSARAAVDFEF